MSRIVFIFLAAILTGKNNTTNKPRKNNKKKIQPREKVKPKTRSWDDITRSFKTRFECVKKLGKLA